MDIRCLIRLARENPRAGAAIVFFSTCIIPIVIAVIMISVGWLYINTTDIPFEYLSKECYNADEPANVDVTSSIFGGEGYNYWAYIADSEEEYCLEYGQSGMSDDIYRQVDFNDYIMIMSVNRPLAAIRIMKGFPVFEDEKVSSYPQFVFGRKEEKNMVYYYKIYRTDTVYKRYGKEVVSRLKLFKEPYAERNSGKSPKPVPMIESSGPLKKWKWAFDLYNSN